jgi:multimeric flavodoxin WrbA
MSTTSASELPCQNEHFRRRLRLLRHRRLRHALYHTELHPEKLSRPSNPEALAEVLMAEFRAGGVETEMVRVVDHAVLPGVQSVMGPGDAWPEIRAKVVAADILVIATPTWLGQPCSIAQRVLERMDAMLSEKADDGRPIAFDKIGGIVVTGNEDGAHHILASVGQALIDIGFTVPGQAWTYWNMGPGPGPDYTQTDHGHAWSARTGRNAARNMIAAAKALKANPLPMPETG